MNGQSGRVYNMSTFNSLHPEIRNALKRNDKARENYYTMSAPYTQIERIMKEHYPEDPDIYQERLVYSKPFGMWFGHHSISATIHSIATYHDVAPLLRTLRKHEWRLHEDGMTRSEWGFKWTLSRNIRPNLDITLHLSADVELADEASANACKRVQVVTKTESIPVYELMCPQGVDGDDDMTHLDTELSEDPTHA
jgi:hypothetical protein